MHSNAHAHRSPFHTLGISLALCTALFLTACGGDAGGGTTTPTPTIIPQLVDNGQSPLLVANGTGIIWYINSATGDDNASGSAATLIAGTNSGPWRTLARLQSQTLIAGDQVVLACGSVWNETLKITGGNKVDGSPTTPNIEITAPIGCISPPQINGSEAILASQWTSYTGTETSGNIYVASLPRTVLQMADNGDTRYLLEAHHPNRGTASPNSFYYPMSADGANVVVNGTPYPSIFGAKNGVKSGARFDANSRVRIRTCNWLLPEKRVISVLHDATSGIDQFAIDSTATRDNKCKPTAEWGYFLLGNLWMLDSAGEWFYDTATKNMYVWMPDGKVPGSRVTATTLATGIDLSSKQYVTVNGLSIKQTGIAVNLVNSVGITLKNCKIQDTVNKGVLMSGSTRTLVHANTLLRSGVDGIDGNGYTNVSMSTDTMVSANTLLDTGVTMLNGDVLSLPVQSSGAISNSLGGTVDGNRIINSGYNGIVARINSTITHNSISTACVVLNDCGGIYLHTSTSHAGNASIKYNVLQHILGGLDGAPASATTHAVGIYLDDLTDGSTVQGNYVGDADYGLQLHQGAYNNILNNTFYGNRLSQALMQDNIFNTNFPNGNMVDNIFTNNQIVPTNLTATGVNLSTAWGTTTLISTFSGNRYVDHMHPLIAYEGINTATDSLSASSSKTYTAAQWQATKGSDNNFRDVNAVLTSKLGYASTKVIGSNIVPNGDLANNATGWTWYSTITSSSPVRTTCAGCRPAVFESYTAEASSGLLISPYFPLTKSAWYRISADVYTDSSAQSFGLILRRNGGDYARLTDRDLTQSASQTWRRFGAVFQATDTVANNGARVDVNTPAGVTVAIANLEIVQIDDPTPTSLINALVNDTNSAAAYACPLTDPVACASFVRLSNPASGPISWPYTLSGLSSEVIFTQDLVLIDSDNDGISNTQDTCPGTATGLAVNSMRIPDQTGRPVHGKLDTDSRANWTLK